MIVFSTIFGSHLYGTSTPTSDRDVKQIHKDSLADIILKRGHDNISNNDNTTPKKVEGELDFESKELRQYINDCLKGQTYALDLLFSPKNLWQSESKIWNIIQDNKDKLVTRNIKPFIGYCQGQARKYSDKSTKLDELISFRIFLEDKDMSGTLGEAIGNEVLEYKHIKVYKKFNSSSKQHDDMLQVADSDYPLHRKLSEVMRSVRDKVDSYGKRSQLARVANGCDYKAFYHAFRVCWELEELLTTGKITFPLLRRNELMDIRNQTFGREAIEEWLTKEIERVLTIPNNLPEPNYTFWEDKILEIYLEDKTC